MAKKAIVVNKVLWRKPITDRNKDQLEVRYSQIGIIINDIDRVLPNDDPGQVMPEQVKSVIRFKRAGTADVPTPHDVQDLIGAINGDIILTIKDPTV